MKEQMVFCQVNIRGVIVAIDIPVELNIEHLFDAMNGYPNPKVTWQVAATKEWETVGACSMSSGDTVVVYNANGNKFMTYVCEPAGWSYIVEGAFK